MAAPKYDWTTLPARYAEKIAEQRLLDEARTALGAAAVDGLSDAALRDAAMAETLAGGLGGGGGLFLGVVADDAARDALGSEADGVAVGAMVFNVARLKLQRHLGSGVWGDVQDAPVRTFNPASYGAVGDGVTDNTAAYATMFSLIDAELTILGEDPHFTGFRIHFPQGVWVGDLVLQNRSGVIVTGQGHGTVLTSPADTAALAVVQLRSCRYSKLADLVIQPLAGKAGVLSGRLSLANGHIVTATGNAYENVLVRAGGQDGWYLKGDGEFVDQNNDLSSWYRCRVEGYSRAAYLIGHSQCKHNRFDHCEFSGGFDPNTVSTDTFDDPATLASPFWWSKQTDAWTDATPPLASIAGGTLTVDWSARGDVNGFAYLQNQAAGAAAGRAVITVDSVAFLSDPNATAGLYVRGASGSEYVGGFIRQDGRWQVFEVSGSHGFQPVGSTVAHLVPAAGDTVELSVDSAGNVEFAHNGVVIVSGALPGHAAPGAANGIYIGSGTKLVLRDYSFTGSLLRDRLHGGVVQLRGSFRFENGGGGANAGADFICCNPNDNIIIRGNDSEGSNRFLLFGGDLFVSTGEGVPAGGYLAGRSAGAMPYFIEGNRFACNGLAPDRRWVVGMTPGPAVIRGNILDVSGGAMPYIWYSPSTGGTISVTDNDITLPGGGRMDVAGQLLYLDPNQPYGAMVECRRNTFRNHAANNAEPLEFQLLPRDVGDLWVYQAGTYYTDNTQPTVLRSLAGVLPGETLTLVARDAVGDGDARTILRHGVLQLKGSTDWVMPVGASITFVGCGWEPGIKGNVWREVSRMDPSQADRPNFGTDDIAGLQYDVGGPGSLLRIWDSRIGVTAEAGALVSIAEARGLAGAAPLVLGAGAAPIAVDAETQTITMPAGVQAWMEAAIPANPLTPTWAPVLVVVYKGATFTPGAYNSLANTLLAGALQHRLLVNMADGGVGVGAVGIYGASSAAALGAADALAVGTKQGGTLTAAALASYAGGALPDGSFINLTPQECDTVQVGFSPAAFAQGDVATQGFVFCAALLLSVVNLPAALLAVKTWAQTHHWNNAPAIQADALAVSPSALSLTLP